MKISYRNWPCIVIYVLLILTSRPFVTSEISNGQVWRTPLTASNPDGLFWLNLYLHTIMPRNMILLSFRPFWVCSQPLKWISSENATCHWALWWTILHFWILQSILLFTILCRGNFAKIFSKLLVWHGADVPRSSSSHGHIVSLKGYR